MPAAEGEEAGEASRQQDEFDADSVFAKLKTLRPDDQDQ
jgi:hypothetical protein